METAINLLSFAEFKKVLAEELSVDEEKITPEASFINDLFVDSIRMLEMILRIETFGVTICPEAAWQIRTVQDAYEYYLDHRV
jgi:acyl carrier protein